MSKLVFTDKEKAEMIPAARIAAAPDTNFWDRLAEYFDSIRKQTAEVVTPRKMRDY